MNFFKTRTEMWNVYDKNDERFLFVWNEQTKNFGACQIGNGLESFLGGRNFHEVIPSTRPQKVKFDIDAKKNEYTDKQVKALISHLCNATFDYFSEEFGDLLEADDFILLDSSSDVKWSFHLILYTRALYYRELLRFFDTIYNDNMEEMKMVDKNTHKRVQNFRLFRCSKFGEERFLRPEKKITEELALCNEFTFEDTLISDYRDVEIMGEEDMEIYEEENIYDNDDRSDIVERILKDNKNVFDGFTLRTFTNGYIEFNRERPTFCAICKRVHDKDNTLVAKYELIDDNIVIPSWQCRRDFTCSMPLPRFFLKSLKQEKTDIDRMREFHPELEYVEDDNPMLTDFNNFLDYGTVLVKAPMKMGKTKNLVKYVEGFKRVIIISFRRTFTNNIQTQLSDFKTYNDENMQNANKLIIQAESLHRLVANGQIPSFDLLVLDESESILEQLCATTHKFLYISNSVFSHLMKYTPRVIAMDAMMTERTSKTIFQYRNDCEGILYNNIYKNMSDYKANFIPTVMGWFSVLNKNIKENKKIIITTDSLESGKIISQYIKEDLKLAPLFISSETDETFKQGLTRNVNSIWKEHNIVIFTPTLTAGVSFEEKHFDVAMAYFCGKSCTAETCVQMLGRVRNLIDKKIYIYSTSAIDGFNEEVEGIYDVICRKTAYEKECDFDFEFDTDNYGNIIPKRTPLMNLHLENKRIQNISRNFFTHRLKMLLSGTGMMILTLPREGKNNELLDTISNIRAAVKQCKVEEIQKAEKITSDDILDSFMIGEKIEPTKLQRYELENYYDIDIDNLNEKEIGALIQQPIRLTYQYIKDLMKHDCYKTAIEKLKKDESKKMQSLIAMNNSIDFSKQFVRSKTHDKINDILGIGGVCLFDIVKKTSQTYNIDSFVTSCENRKEEVLNKLSEVRVINDIHKYNAGNIIKQINQLLKKFYGISLRTDGKIGSIKMRGLCDKLI